MEAQMAWWPFAAVFGLALVLALVGTPLAGAIVDRRDRRWAMIVSDAGAGCCTLAIALLLSTGRLDIWHIYLLTGISSAFGTVQWPAFMASINCEPSPSGCSSRASSD